MSGKILMPLCFLTGAVVASVACQFMPANDNKLPSSVTADGIVAAAVDRENAGRAAIYQDLSSALEAGDVSSMEEMVEFVKVRIHALKGEAFAPMVNQLEQYNGERWDRLAVKEIVDNYSQGFLAESQE